MLVLTTYDTDADIQRALDAGAAGHLLKDADRDELVRAIEHVAAGKVALAPAVASRVVGRLRGPGPEPLTRREIEVLEHVAAGRSNRAVARARAIGEATVKTHPLHIFRKLGVEDRTSAVTGAVQRGIIRLDRHRRAVHRRWSTGQVASAEPYTWTAPLRARQEEK